MLQEPGTRETRHHARELKFLASADVGHQVLLWSRARLAPDAHGSGPAGDEYRTTSLYFDTDRFDVYHRRGSYRRSKYRIRRYGQHGPVFFERKLRTAAILTKRRTPVGVDALGVLMSKESEPDWTGAWFRRRIEIRRLKPVCQVSYQRVARTHSTPLGIARLTIDRGISVRETSFPEFHPADGGVRVLDERVIVEIKFIDHPPALFKELVQLMALETSTVSKYRLAVDALRLPAAMREAGGAPFIPANLAHA